MIHGSTNIMIICDLYGRGM